MEKKENTKTKAKPGRKKQKHSGKNTKPRRKRVKHPALNNEYNLRSRHQYNDYDYIDQLSEEEKDWLNKFTEEYSNAAVGKQSEAEKNKFHTTVEMVKDCTDRNNARNRDIMNKHYRVEGDFKGYYGAFNEEETSKDQVQAIEDLIDANRKNKNYC